VGWFTLKNDSVQPFVAVDKMTSLTPSVEGAVRLTKRNPTYSFQ